MEELVGETKRTLRASEFLGSLEFYHYYTGVDGISYTIPIFRFRFLLGRLRFCILSTPGCL